MVGVLHSLPGGAQAGPVPVEHADRHAEPADHGADPVVERNETVDHTPVVGGVAMVVGDATGPHLPVVTDANEFDVQGKELRVRGPGRVLAVPGEAELVVGRDSPFRGQDQRAAPRHCVPHAEHDVIRIRIDILDPAAEAELEQARSVVHTERISRRVVACAHMRNLGTGTIVFAAKPVRGVWRMLTSPDDVLGLMDAGAGGVIAGVQDAGATFLAPIFDELTAVVCMSGTPSSHIGIVSREYRVPCLMATDLVGGMPVDGAIVEVDCSDDVGVVRAAG